MAILNYTTEVPVKKSVSQIQEMLAKAGVQRISIEYEGAAPLAVSFLLELDGKIQAFWLPCNWRAIKEVCKAQKLQARFLTDDHARRIGWRILKDHVEVLLALVAINQAEMAEAFFQYLVVRREPSGENISVYKQFKIHQQLLLKE
jgi:hypothetical protein